MYDDIMLGAGVVMLIVVIIYILWAGKIMCESLDRVNKSGKEVTKAYERLLRYIDDLERLHKR